MISTGRFGAISRELKTDTVCVYELNFLFSKNWQKFHIFSLSSSKMYLSWLTSKLLKYLFLFYILGASYNTIIWRAKEIFIGHTDVGGIKIVSHLRLAN